MAHRMIFEPIRIGNIEIPNRVVRTAHHTGLTVPGKWDTFIAYHTERAKGGCGLSILDGASIHPSNAHEAQVYDDAFIPHYQRLMQAVKPYGMKIFQQLWYGGNIYHGLRNAPPYAVSTLPGYFGFVGIAMSAAQIAELVEGFASGAERCRQAGLHGVEIHASHGYIFHQFLAPAYNNRTDGYGGSLQNRARFIHEVLRAIKLRVGNDIAVGARFSTGEGPGGVSMSDNQAVIRMLQAEKLLDFVDASVGDYYRMDSMVGGMHNPTGYELHSSGQLTAVATVPRIVAGRYRTIDDAEQVLREGKADLVSMVRAQIADPYLVQKTRQGRPLSVRPCIGCNQGCLGGANRDRHIGCTVNAAVGREDLLTDNVIPKTASPRTVLVIGGGPAGLEAARVAAESGHRVILLEAQAALGGAVNAAKKAPWMQSLGDITAWLEQEVYRLGVDVRLGTWCEIEDVDASGADVVIVATGSRARLDGFQLNVAGEPASGCEQPHVVSSSELLLGKRPLGKTALVLDTVGHFEAIGAAEFLIENGLAVTYLTGLGGFAPFTDPTGRSGPALERLYKGDFQILTRHQIVSIGANSCAIKPIHADKTKIREIPADTVVLVTPNEPQTEIVEALRAAHKSNVYVIGDAKAPRDLQVAIADGNDVARSIG